MDNSILNNLQQVDVISTGDVKVFNPIWKLECFFAISPSVKEALEDPFGVVQKLPVSGNLEVTFKRKNGSYLDFYLDTSTKLTEGMMVHIDDLIGEYLIRGDKRCARYLHTQDVNLE